MPIFYPFPNAQFNSNLLFRDTCDSPLHAGEKAVDLFQGFMYRKVIYKKTLSYNDKQYIVKYVVYRVKNIHKDLHSIISI